MQGRQHISSMWFKEEIIKGIRMDQWGENLVSEGTLVWMIIYFSFPIYSKFMNRWKKKGVIAELVAH